MFDGVYMVNKVISNTGPIIHLGEIMLLNALDIFPNILITNEVLSELNKYKVSIPKRIKVIDLSNLSKDNVKLFTNQHDLDLGEASAIALAIQEKAIYFITDDLEARVIAQKYGLEVHGTIGIVLRAFREKIIDKKTTINKINELYHKSSLFITKDLVEDILKEIN